MRLLDALRVADRLSEGNHRQCLRSAMAADCLNQGLDQKLKMMKLRPGWTKECNKIIEASRMPLSLAEWDQLLDTFEETADVDVGKPTPLPKNN
jgi:hypothetical protein